MRDNRHLSNGKEDFWRTSLTTKLTTRIPGLNTWHDELLARLAMERRQWYELKINSMD